MLTSSPSAVTITLGAVETPYQEHTSRLTQSFDKVARSAADPAQTKTNNEVIQVDHWRIDRSDAWGGNYKLKYILSLLINY